MTVDVLVIGDYCLDIIYSGLPGEPELGREIYADKLDVTIGGATYPTAMALRRLGLKSEIYMQVGSDFFSKYAHDMLVQSGFDPDFLHVEEKSYQRVTTALSYPQDRAFISFAEGCPPYEPGNRFRSDVLLGREIRHIHIAHLSAGLEAIRLMDEASKNGISVSMDCGWNPKALADPRLKETISRVDVFMPNEVEVLRITGAPSLEAALDEIAKIVDLTVVKLGVEGSVAVSKKGKVQVSAIQVDAIETTAAGDCFNAGFLYGYLSGFSLEDSLRSGNICGGLSITAPGWANTPDLTELQRWLRRYHDGKL